MPAGFGEGAFGDGGFGVGVAPPIGPIRTSAPDAYGLGRFGRRKPPARPVGPLEPDRFGLGGYARRYTFPTPYVPTAQAATGALVLGRLGATGEVVYELAGEAPPDVPAVFPRHRAPVVYVLDAGRKPVAVLHGYELFEWIDKYRDPDEWTLVIDARLPGAKALAAGTFIAAPLSDGVRVGLIEGPGASMTTGGVEAVVVTGRCYGAMLGARNAMIGTGTGTGYDSWTPSSTWKGGAPGSGTGAMAYFVWHHAIGDADLPLGHRTVPDLVVGPVPSTDVRVHYNARFQPLTEILLEICLYGGLGWRVRYDDLAGQFVFEPQRGRDMTGLVKFSPEFGAVTGIGFSKNTRDARNLAWVAGQGEGAEREVRGFYDEALFPRGPPSGLALREMVVDARDIGPDSSTTLKQRGEERLAELGAEESVEFELLVGGPYEYPRDFRPGDVVAAEYPGWAYAESRIVAVGQRWTRSGRAVTVSVGSEPSDTRKVVIDLARRQRQTERA